MRVFHYKTVAALTLMANLITSQTVSASNVGGVFGPGVTEGDRSFQYRGAFDPDNNDFVQRIHYQQALNSDLRLRGVLQARKTDESDVDFDFFQGELQWQLKGSSAHKHALRLDLRVRDQGRNGNIGVNWTNEFKLSPTLSARAIVLTLVDVGSEARSGVFLQTRASLSHKLNDKLRLSAELFSNYGSTADFRSFDEQTHQIGPAVSGKLGKDWSFFSGVLVGATDASPDSSLRLWISKSFK